MAGAVLVPSDSHPTMCALRLTAVSVICEAWFAGVWRCGHLTLGPIVQETTRWTP